MRNIEMKRVLSLWVLAVYGAQLMLSCGVPSTSEDPTASVRELAARMANRAPLSLPADTVLPTETQGGTAAGATPGNLDVTADGAATYSLPLWTPVGRGGVEPSLALTYRSGRGNGLVGVGWGLSGVSQISRCPKTLAQDGTLAPIAFDGSDSFCLDGQRLVQVASGAGWTEYRTEVDSFAKVMAHEPDALGPTWFEVRLQDGRVMSYGTHQAERHSRLEGRRVVVEPLAEDDTPFNTNYDGFARLSWGLSEVADRSGNRMAIYYGLSEDVSDGYAYEQWPSQIRYTFGPTGSPLEEARRSVSFNYELRTDSEFSFVSGFKLKTTRRLSRVDMWGPPAGLLRSYILRYRDDSITRRSLLREVQECDGDGICKRPTLFDWELGDRTFRRHEQAVPEGAEQDSLRGLDVNGDGLEDVLYLAEDGSGWRFRLSVASPTLAAGEPMFSGPVTVGLPAGDYSTPSSTYLLETADLDLDGRSDIVLARYTGLVNRVPLPNGGYIPAYKKFTLTVHLSTGTSFTSTGSSREAIDYEPFDNPALKLTDLDGDARPEVVFSRGPNEDWFYYHFDGAELGTSTALPAASGRLALLSADIDGDGTVELLARAGYPGSASVWYHGFGLTPQGQPKSWNIAKYSADFLNKVDWSIDLNGDGLADQVVVSRSGGDPILSLNTGRGFLEAGLRVMPTGFGFPSSGGQYSRWDPGVRVLDYDGDGHQDFLYSSSTTGSTGMMPLLLTRGTFFETQVLKDETNTPLPSTYKSVVADVNGDGQADIVSIGGNGDLRAFVRKGPRADLLKSVRDGMNYLTYVAYAPLSDGRVYSGVSGAGPCSYPVLCVKGGAWVVSRVDMLSSAWGDGVRYDYSYAGGRRDVRGRGWLGFRERVVKNSVTGTTATTTYDNLTTLQSFYPNTRRPVAETLQAPLGDGRTLTLDRLTTYTHSVRPGSGGGQILSPSQTDTVDREWEVPPSSGGAVLRQRQSSARFDTLYGNLLFSEMFAGDGEGSTWSATYEDDPSAWLLGRTDRVTVVGSAGSGGVVARTTDYDYVPGTALLHRVTVEPTVTGSEADDVRLVTTYHRLPSGVVERVEETDAQGRLRSVILQYDDEQVHLATTTNRLGHRTDFAYHPGLGVLALTEDANGLRTQRKYDGFGRLRFVNTAGGNDLSLSYGRDELERMTLTQQSSSGQELHSLHDWAGREIQRRTRNFDGGFSVVGMGYDELGRLTSASVPYSPGTTATVPLRRFEYDGLGRLRKVTQPDGSTILHTYQQLEHWTTDENGHTRYVVENQSGRVIRSVDVVPSGNPLVTRYEYGPFGVLSAVVDAHENRVSMQYDRLGRATMLNDPDLGQTVLRYNAFDDLREQVDAAGAVTTFHHDDLGRVTSEVRPDDTSQFVWDTALDANGVPNGLGLLARVTNERDPANTLDDVSTAFVYDSFGRPHQEFWNIEGQVYDVERTYDAFGRLDTLSYPAVGSPSRLKVRYGYTAWDTLRHVEQLAPSAKPLWTAQARDVAGRVSSEQFGNGVTTARRYDPEGQLRFLEAQGSAGPIQRLAYDYEANGNLRQRHDLLAKVSETFTYDSLERLTDWTVTLNCRSSSTHYEYDAIGNLTLRRTKVGEGAGAVVSEVQPVYTGGAPHAVKTFGTTSYGYDVKGNRRTSSDTATGESVSIDYTAFNLPTQISRGSDTLTFIYDAAHRRVAKKRSNGDSTVYVGNLYEKRVIAGKQLHVFNIQAEGRTVAQVSWEANGAGGMLEKTLYLHDDHLGSVESITDASGAVVERRKYEPFGEARSPVNPALPRPAGGSDVTKGFTSHEEDAEAGLINMRGRMYDPKTARFLTPDPVVQAPVLGQSYNRYSYVFNSPLNHVDPTGFSGITLHHGGGTVSFDGMGGAVGYEDIFVTVTDDTWAGFSSGGTDFTGSIVSSIASDMLNNLTNSLRMYVGAFTAVKDMAIGMVMASQNPLMAAVQMGQGLNKAYEEDGVLGVANFFNPVYHSLTAGYMAMKAYEKGDFEGVGYNGFHSALNAASAVTGPTGIARAATTGALTSMLNPVGRSGLIVRSSGGLDVPTATILRNIQRGERVADILAEIDGLTRATHKEYAVLVLENRKRVLVQGGRDGIDFSKLNVRRMVLHSHPRGSAPGPSSYDFDVLAAYKQRSSWLLEVDNDFPGNVIKYSNWEWVRSP
ncbi:FG-GAP-like repeat-containing protein [Pyxidicoccus sp. 3LG]